MLPLLFHISPVCRNQPEDINYVTSMKIRLLDALSDHGLSFSNFCTEQNRTKLVDPYIILATCVDWSGCVDVQAILSLCCSHNMSEGQVFIFMLTANVKTNIIMYLTAVCSRSPLFTLYNTDSDMLGPVVQSIVSLMSLLVVKMLTVLVSTISNSQLFLLKKMWVVFANAKATHIFSAKILAKKPYLMIKVLTIR